MSEKTYDSKQIRVLKGLDPVKQVPGMYTRTDNPNHIIYEAIDNAQDEALGGHASKISIKMPDIYTVMVEDNGRGIPIDPMEDEDGKPAIEVILTSLHSGGKFNKADGGAYAFSGGLHGVGVSVTNALSSSLSAIVKKDGKIYEIGFEDGNLTMPLKETGKVAKNNHGTCIIAKPNPKYFDSPIVNIEQLKNYVRVKSALLHNVEISFQYMEEEPILWSYPTLKDYLLNESNKLNHEETYWKTTEEQSVSNKTDFVWNFEHYLKKSSLGADGEGINLVLGFVEEGKRISESFVNLIPTLNGGTHERGLKNGLFEGLKSFMNFNNLTPQKLNVEADDLWIRASFVLSAKLLEPKFQGQTKEKLNYEPAAKMITGLVKDNFEHWLNDNSEFGKKLSEMVIQNAQKRTKGELPVDRKRSTGANILPGKLTDCTETNLDRTELFICEGDSAGGGAKMARDKLFQAIFPIRGKILNVWEVEQHKLFESETIENISLVIGIPPHTMQDKVDFTKLRYGKICTMCDADVDGRHIEVLLLTLFLRHFPQVVIKGHLYVARAPLFRVDYPSSKKSKKADKKAYIQDEQELEKMLKNLKKDFSEDVIKVSRFKGLGEMKPEQLWETTMSPDGRHLIQITMDADHMDSDIEAFNLYMSKKEAKKRKDWMEENGNKVQIDV